MKAWWISRSPRERLILLAAAGLIGAGLFFQLALSPIVRWRSESGARAAAAEETYRLVARAAAGAGAKAAASDVPIRNALTASAASLQVGLAFVNALPDGSVDMQTDPVAPEKVFEMLARLEAEHGIRAKTVDIARSLDDKTLVRVQATLSR